MRETIENYADFGKYEFNSKNDFSNIAKSEAKILGILYSKSGESTNTKVHEYEKRLTDYLEKNVAPKNISHVNVYYNFEESDFFEHEFMKEKVTADLRIEDENSLKWFKDRASLQKKLRIRRDEISCLPNTRLKKAMLHSYSNEIKMLDIEIAECDVNDALNNLINRNFRFANLCLYASNLYEKLLPDVLLSKFDNETKAYFSEFIGNITCYSNFDVERSSVIKGVKNCLGKIEDCLGIEYDSGITTGMTSDSIQFDDVYIFDDNEIKIKNSYDLRNIRPEMAKIANEIKAYSGVLSNHGLEKSAKASRSLINSKIFNLTRHASGQQIKNKQEVLA